MSFLQAVISGFRHLGQEDLQGGYLGGKRKRLSDVQDYVYGPCLSHRSRSRTSVFPALLEESLLKDEVAKSLKTLIITL